MSHAFRMNGDTLVDVAQLVEPRIVIPAVVGSNPIVHPILGRVDPGRLDPGRVDRVTGR